MTGREVAKRVLEGEDPKQFFRQAKADRNKQQADRENRRGYYREFIRSYVETALWSSTDDEGRPLDQNYSPYDIDPAAYRKMEDDCIAFCEQNWDAISHDLSQAGHDFWLTRNHHGAGFWDGDWETGDELTKASHAFGEVNLDVGDDGKIYA